MAFGKPGRPPKDANAQRTWLTIGEAAKALGVTHYRLREGLEAGHFPGQKFGRSWLISAAVIQRVLKDGTAMGGTNYGYKEKAEYEGIPTAYRVQ